LLGTTAKNRFYTVIIAAAYKNSKKKYITVGNGFLCRSNVCGNPLRSLQCLWGCHIAVRLAMTSIIVGFIRYFFFIIVSVEKILVFSTVL